MSNHLQGKTLVVTGAASGFGRLVSERAVALGANVLMADINAEALEQASSSLGAAALAVPTDVSDLPQMQQLAGAGLAQFGRLDVWINNAGIMPLAFFKDHMEAAAAWHRCIDINLKGVLNGMIAAYDPMIDAGQGQIVNLSSIYSNFPVVGAAVYGATKAAVNFLSESFRVESQGRIKVTIVRPTGIPTTGLATGVVNPEAVVGILGQNAAQYGQLMQGMMAGELPEAYTSDESIEYFALAPEHLADQIIYAINQPAGVSIGDITVRASGDSYIL
ncbi:MAG: SDR family NAD(P)-dependent oxidoreductase [Pseudomonadota bacterium]